MSSGRIDELYGQLGCLIARTFASNDQAAIDRTEHDLEVLVACLEYGVAVPCAVVLPPSPPTATFVAPLPPPPPPPSSPTPPPADLPRRRRMLPEVGLDSFVRDIRAHDESALGFEWHNPKLWQTARIDPQALAMVGDTVMDTMIVIDGYDAGGTPQEMTQMKQHLVSNRNLTAIGQAVGLDIDYKTNEPLQGKAVADQIEALIGAIYLDHNGGIGAVRRALWHIGMFRPWDGGATSDSYSRSGGIELSRDVDGIQFAAIKLRDPSN